MSLNTHDRNRGATDTSYARINTPLNIGSWAHSLRNNPDKDYVRYILTGIEHGFQIGVKDHSPLRSASKNMQSANQNEDVIENYLSKEIAAGNILGPIPLSSSVHINRFGVIPKKHQMGKWRLITDLSFPEGYSVNDAIDSELCSMSYISVDLVARRAMSLGRGALIAKIDIKSAYRLVPICGFDRQWLGMRWKDQTFVDGMLPFGLRSAPKIFNALADALEWIVFQAGVQHIFHYLDDFAVIGSPGSGECQHTLNILARICDNLGVPVALGTWPR